jgi:hypothetical protein
LLVREDRGDPRARSHGRHADEAAGAKDDVGFKSAEQAPCPNRADWNAHGIGDRLSIEVAPKLAGRNRRVIDAGVLGSGPLDTIAAANPKQVCRNVAAPELLDYGDSGEHMTAGAAARDHDSKWTRD